MIFLTRIIGRFIQRWRADPSAILPLVFLHAFGLLLLEVSTIQLFHNIHCDVYKQRSNLVWIQVYPPPTNQCDVVEVQRGQSSSIAMYFGIVTALNVIVSGTYGRLSDEHGRKYVMRIGAVFNIAGSIWLSLCAYFPPLRTLYFLMPSCIFLGIGGGLFMSTAGHLAFIADTSSLTKRSVHLGVALVACWIARGVATLMKATLSNVESSAVAFSTGVGTWLIYLLYLVFVLREARTPPEHLQGIVCGADEDRSQFEWSPLTRKVFHTLADPVAVVIGDPLLRRLGIAWFVMHLALGAISLDVLLQYCDDMLAMDTSEKGLITGVLYASRSLAVLCVLPVFVTILNWFIVRRGRSSVRDLPVQSESSAESQAELATSTETAPLLPSSLDDDSAETQKIYEASILREKIVSCASFAMEAVGMILLSSSQNVVEIINAIIIGALGAPAQISLQTLVTFAAAPDSLGRVLVGFSLIEMAANAISSRFLSALYRVTYKEAPGMVWGLCGGLLALSFAIVAFKRSSIFKSNGRN